MQVFKIWTWLVLVNTKRNCKFHCTAVSLCNYKLTNAHLMKVRIAKHILRARFRLSNWNSGVKLESPILVMCWCTCICCQYFPMHVVVFVLMFCVLNKNWNYLKIWVKFNYCVKWGEDMIFNIYQIKPAVICIKNHLCRFIIINVWSYFI